MEMASRRTRVSVRIRLKRFGTKKKPFYRIVVVDSRSPRDGRVIEEVGLYHPIEKEEKQIAIREERIKEWLGKGATPSDMVKKILNRAAAK
jgi:small subunit ribosomal protein S16